MRNFQMVGGIVLSCFLAGGVWGQTAPSANINHPALAKLHWQLGCQAASFGDISFFEMVDQLHAMGVHHIELSPGQAISSEFPRVKIGPEMTDGQIGAMQTKLKSVKMDVVSYGIVPLRNDFETVRQLFGFAKKLKLKNVVVRPTNISLEALDKVATESGVHVAILTEPDAGWDCDTFLKLILGRSAMVGVCLDVSDLRKAGLSLDDCVQKLEGHIVEVNLTDVADEAKGGGKIDLPGLLDRLAKQNYRGIFAVQSSVGTGAERMGHWVESVNVFSSATGKVAGLP